jgi:hypothetical protein
MKIWVTCAVVHHRPGSSWKDEFSLALLVAEWRGYKVLVFIL